MPIAHNPPPNPSTILPYSHLTIHATLVIPPQPHRHLQPHHHLTDRNPEDPPRQTSPPLHIPSALPRQLPPSPQSHLKASANVFFWLRRSTLFPFHPPHPRLTQTWGLIPLHSVRVILLFFWQRAEVGPLACFTAIVSRMFRSGVVTVVLGVFLLELFFLDGCRGTGGSWVGVLDVWAWTSCGCVFLDGLGVGVWRLKMSRGVVIWEGIACMEVFF